MQQNELLTTMSTSNNINGEARLTWDDSAGLLTVKHGYAGGGGTGLYFLIIPLLVLMKA